ncbi:squalene synthase HpnC [Streptomyces thermolineatus]|uniref:squalene synthase HpnC n=1 Tax=Streptomyces thermolineatus TaxID=44033 RepID=UPI00384DA31C
MTARTDASSRAVLDKAARENFPVAPFFLPAAWRNDLMAVYGCARLVDDAGDGDLPPGRGDAALLGVPGDAADDRLVLLDAIERDLLRAFDGAGGAGGTEGAGSTDGGPRHPLVRALRPTVLRHRLDPGPFLALIEANRQDQRTTRYATWDDLLAYCDLSANPVGRLVLAITGTTSPERLRRSDEICTALQIAEHLQDVAEDLARGRIYLPAEDMERFGVTEADLARPTGSRAVRDLVRFEADRARALLDAGAPLVGSVRGRLRPLLAGFVAGGRAALAALEDADHDPLPGPPRASRARLVREAAAALRGPRR